MDVIVPSIWLSSFAGALLLYAGGRLSPRRAEAGAGPATQGPIARESGPDVALSLELEAERAARGRAEEHAAGIRKTLDEAMAALGEERTRRAALHDELEGERAARARADAEAANERQRLIDETTKLRGDLATAVAAGKRLSAEAAGLRAKAAEHERTAAHLAQAQAQATAAAAAAKTEGAADHAAKEDLAELQRRNVEVTMKLRALEQRTAEMDRKEAENVELRRRVEALSASAAEAADLRRRLDELMAQGYARQKLGALHALEDLPVSTGRPELETSLVLELRALCQQEEGCRAAVLSDMRGLLVAAYGDPAHREELAAAASLTTMTAERLTGLLPLGAAARMIVVDENATVFGTRWLRWDDECFLLSTLGAAAPAEKDASGALRARIEELIGAS